MDLALYISPWSTGPLNLNQRKLWELTTHFRDVLHNQQTFTRAMQLVNYEALNPHVWILISWQWWQCTLTVLRRRMGPFVQWVLPKAASHSVDQSLTPHIYNRGLGDSGLCKKTESFSASGYLLSSHRCQRWQKVSTTWQLFRDILMSRWCWRSWWTSPGKELEHVGWHKESSISRGERLTAACPARSAHPEDRAPDSMHGKQNIPSATLAHQWGLNHVFFREHSKPGAHN